MLHPLTASDWAHKFSASDQKNATIALESGLILFLPHLSFQFNDSEKDLLRQEVLSGAFKNISFHPKTGKVKGVADKLNESRVSALMSRFFQSCSRLIDHLLPHYRGALLQGRTSYRPVEVIGRKTSLLKDDTRLHVDAFPATPNQGKRILRVFSNVNPNGQSRFWQVGEPFKTVVTQFLPKLRPPFMGYRALLSLLNITKSYRSIYDHYMLMLHDEMKKSDTYQNSVKKTDIHFPAGGSWVVMTDAVSHAALSGQFVLEQTFYLPFVSMAEPEKSPLRILERALNQPLVNI